MSTEQAMGAGQGVLEAGGEAAQTSPPQAEPALTIEQELAVARRREPLLLRAGAGSGKTSVLVERFVRSVLEDGVAPGRILAITFTERAAGELRERVRARLLSLGSREAARDTEAAFVGTFHGFCARLLRAHPLALGLDPRFAILDEDFAGRLRERAFAAAVAELLAGETPALVDLLAAYGVDQARAMVFEVHSELRSRGRREPRLPRPAPADPGDERAVAAVAACGLLDTLLAAFGARYEAAKRARGGLDFDDLELLAGELLREHDSLRVSWSRRFELIMVDEFQDTNPRQLEIVNALERDNLFTVGDELQAIYGFRHADVRLFRARAEELAGRGGTLALRGNFRSRPPLLDVVNALFAERMGDGYEPLVAARRDGRGQGAPGEAPEPRVELLLSARSGWPAVEEQAPEIAAELPTASAWRAAEALALARRVRELVREGHARPGEVVVLLRALGDIETYERALQLQGLRTLAMVGGFWSRLHTLDLLAYLRVLANPLDERALYAALASPLCGLSGDGLGVIAQVAQADGRGAWETACAPRSARAHLESRLGDADRAALRAFCEHVQGERACAVRRPIAQLLERAMQASGYLEHVRTLDSAEQRLANVHKLLRQARRYEASEGRDLRGFLDHVERLQRSGAGEADAPVAAVEPDAVRLMTVHAAKGLEFPVVCVADLGRAPNTRTPRLLVDGERIGLALLRLDGEKAVPTLAYEELSEERRRAQAQEEDRILYVAMTRARERLLLSGAIDLERWGERRDGPPAAWLVPGLAAEVPQPLAEGRSGVCDVPVPGAPQARVRWRLNLPDGADARARPAGPAAPPQGPSASAPGGDAGPGEQLSLTLGEVADRPREQPPLVAAPPAQMATLSYSSLAELERCGYRYYLERVLGLAEDRSAARARDAQAGLEARARGTLVHGLLEALDFASAAGPDAQAVGRAARELGLRAAPGECEEIAALIARACRSRLAQRIAAARPQHREHPFAFALSAGEPLVTGVIDLLAAEAEGRMLVVDYKSDRVAPASDLAELAELAEREYGLQRMLYALAVLRDGAAAVEVVHWFLERPGEPVAVAYERSQQPALRAAVAERLARARARGYAVSDAPHRGLCLGCPGRGSLCSWSEEMTLRDFPQRAPEGAEQAKRGA